MNGMFLLKALLLMFCMSKRAWANSQLNSPSLRYVPSLGDTSPGSVWPQPQSQTSTAQVNFDIILLRLRLLPLVFFD